jgi:hypothetical protein
MRNLTLVCVAGVLLALSACATTSTRLGARIERVDVENNVSKYCDHSLELVAFAPGSGWIKIKTRRGASPTLSFDSVSNEDVQRFNRFAERVGVPIRTKLSGNVLHLIVDKTQNKATFVADSEGWQTKVLAKSLAQMGIWQSKEPTRLAVQRDKDGRVFLVRATDSPNESDTLLADMTE